MVDVEAILQPYYDRLLAETGPLSLFDAHTHVGANDPDGFRAANDFVIEAAAASGGRLVPYCRVNPHDAALAEATRALEAGARGIKLHPRAERFGLGEPAVRDLVAPAHHRGLPVL